MLVGRNLGYAGGAEVEQVHLGRELATNGYDICFVTYRHGRNQIEYVDGIKIIKTYDRDKTDQLNALFKYMSIWSALKKADADIYFHQSGSQGVLPLFCYLNRKKFVHRIASDAVVLGKPLYGKYGFTEKFVDILELKKANAVVAQSNFQSRVLKERLGVENVVIKNGLMIPEGSYEKQSPPVILWVGSISSIKRPHLFVELAKSIPHTNFEMIGGKAKREPQLYNDVTVAAQKLPNLRFHGFIPYHRIDDYFKRAAIFVNTSSIEGFPNTFLQAWAQYSPVVSLNVDPDDIIRKEKLGFCSGTFKRLITDLITLLENETLRKNMGERAREYVEKEHDIKEVVKKYIKIFNKLS
jgi:glycosyltransferase involved in cell wall biosynthesis